MRSQGYAVSFCIALFLFAAQPAARADNLLGKHLQASGESPLGNAGGGSQGAIVGPGTEYSGLWCCNSMNVSASQILIDFNSTNQFSLVAGFNGWAFRDVTDNFRDFFAVRLNPASTITPSGLSFNANEIFVNMSGIGFSANDFILIDAIIPEPSTAALVLLGAFGLAGRRNRRRQALSV